MKGSFKFWSLGGVFLLLFCASFFLHKGGRKVLVFEQNRPQLLDPLYQCSLEEEEDRERFRSMVAMVSEENNLPFEQVERAIYSALEVMESSIPFTFASKYYSLRCLPNPCSPYEVHKRIHLGDSSLGIPIYLDVRVYKESKDFVLENLFSSFEGEFYERNCDRGISYIAFGKGDKAAGHGLARNLGERALFFHLVEAHNCCYVAYVEGARSDIEPLLNEEDGEIACCFTLSGTTTLGR